MNFSELSILFDRIESTPSRNSKIEILAEFIKQLQGDEVNPFCYLLSGRVVPVYIPLEFNFSSNMIIRSLGRIYDEATIKSYYEESGDLGDVLYRLKSSSKSQEDFSINYVYDSLKKIALTTGKGSQEAKLTLVIDIISKIDPLSAKYIARILIGKMRLGLNDKTLLDSLSWAVAGDKSLREKIDRAYGVRSDLGEIASLCLFGDIEDLENLKIQLGTPVAAKLVERVKDTSEIYQRLEGCIIQPKFDGLRAQIHFTKEGKIVGVNLQESANEQILLTQGDGISAAIFSRNMEQMTEMFPDVVQSCAKLNATSAVIDSEIIGYDESTNSFIPFQETMTRKRKYGIENKTTEVPVKVFAFDCLYHDGEDITQYPLVKRLEILKNIISTHGTIFEFSESKEFNSADQIEDSFNHYVDMGLEGIIAKSKTSLYKPGSRNFDWIKLKATSKVGFVDSIDTVVIGYYHGKGQRAKFGVGALLLAIIDTDSNKFLSIAKLGTGIKDDQWIEIKKSLDKITSEKMPDNYIVGKNLYPDVWVYPDIVCEVDYDQITSSKIHLQGNNDANGYSVRFPRLKKIREDKSPQQITTTEEIKQMFDLQ